MIDESAVRAALASENDAGAPYDLVYGWLEEGQDRKVVGGARRWTRSKPPARSR